MKAATKPLVANRKMKPEDVGMRFEDTYGDGYGNKRYGIAVSIYSEVRDHNSSRGPIVTWTVVGMDGHTTNLDNCWVED